MVQDVQRHSVPYTQTEGLPHAANESIPTRGTGPLSGLYATNLSMSGADHWLKVQYKMSRACNKDYILMINKQRVAYITFTQKL